MPSPLVQLVQQGYEAWNSGDRSWVLEHMSDDVEWMTPTGDPDPGVYRGRQGVEEYWAQWRAAVGQLSFNIEEMIDAGDAVIVVAERQGRGEHSGLQVSDHVIQVFEFEGDQCVRVKEYYDRDTAFSSVQKATEAADRARESR